jgi:4-hydroxyacetophenone monooxygenase
MSVDREAAAAALGEANLAVLLSAMAHVTGDLDLLDRHPDPRQFDHGRGPGSLPEDEAQRIREEALALLEDLDESPLASSEATPGAPRPALGAAALHRIVEFCAGEPVSAEYVPMIEEEANFDGDDPRRFTWTESADPDALRGFRVGIIGAGLGGLALAIRLGQAGIPYTVFEKNPDVGGTWFENTYPDLRVDVPNHFYSYSFRPNPDWSHYYARRDELSEYIVRCADDYGVIPHIRFGTEVVIATYDDDRGGWSVRLRTAGDDGPDEGEDEVVRVDVLVSAVGMLSRPSVPEIEGLESFAGPWFHSARWDHDVDLAGKRVAVVGTGASAMQFVPAIAPVTDRLTIFQRARHWVTPNPNYRRPVTEGERWLFRNVPYYLGWYRFLMFWNSADRMYPAFRVDPEWPDRELAISRPNDKMRRIMTAHVERELAERPELVAEVLPDYPALGKRMLQDNGWFAALCRENVELVNDRIARVEPGAVVTASGRRVESDVLVLATGFLPNKYLWPMEIVGRDGTVLQDVWGDDPRAYLGITVPGFPNLFCLYGPNTNPVVGSVISVLECQVNYVVKAIATMIGCGFASIECRRDVHDEYNERVDSEHEQLVWRHHRVHSYYNNSRGRVTTNMPWKLFDYWRMTHEPSLDDFVVRPR